MREGKLVLLLSDRYLVQGQAAGARAARDRRRASSPGADRAALQVQSADRDRHGARPASFRLSHRLRRHGRVSVHGLPGPVRDDAQGPREARLRDAPRARPQLPRRRSQGPVQDHVEDGHLDHRQLSQLAAVRDRRTVGRGGGPVLSPAPRAVSQGADFDDLESDTEAARRARLEPARADGAGRPAQVRARWRVPHVQPRRDRRAAGGRDLAATTSTTSCSRSW